MRLVRPAALGYVGANASAKLAQRPRHKCVRWEQRLAPGNLETFDYVVIGGGSAGSLLAARLSDNPAVSVCLIEAGERDRNLLFQIPAGFIKVIFDPACTWSYETDPGPGIEGRKVPVIQGRVLGGSGSINGMVYTRGQAEDFDHWAALGNPNWSYRDLLPYFKACERRVGEADETYRGRTGGMPVVDLNWPSTLNDAFIAAAQKQGIPYNPDYNGQTQAGVGRYQYNIGRGWRKSAARSFLKPVENRANLKVLTGTMATALNFEGKRVTGMAYRRSDGTTGAIAARREVVLCCGAVNTPKLLQLSGVGPGALLQSLGIAVNHAAEGVGANYQDHFTPRLTYRATNVDTINEFARGTKLAGQLARWILGQPSILGIGVVLGCAFWKTRPELTRPNVVVTFTPGSFKAGFLGRLDDVPGMTCGVWQLRPDSRGLVRITSPDPGAKPSIQPNFLTDPRDQETVVEALKLGRRIMASPEIAQYCAAETMPGPMTQSDDELLAYARQQGLCGYHSSGTCRMGPDSDADAVVDSQLRVRGVDGLRIADASIMPTMVSGNTNATTMAIAAKAADLIAQASSNTA